MPSKHSPRINRPPSPYSVSQSPRIKSQQSQRVWRSLSGTGESDSSNAFAEKSREMWLKSLRRGGDVGNITSYRSNVSNPSLSSTSDHLRMQLGLPNSARKHKRSSSAHASGNLTFSPTALQGKSKEDLCDEIISLKRMLVAQKDDYEVLKTKSRRLEEENTRNSKFIEELLDKRTSDEKVRMLAVGGGRSSSNAVNTGLKQKILKLEKRLVDKEKELTEIKRDIKLTDMIEMKAAMELYYQEVLRLQDVMKSEEVKVSRLSSSMGSVTAAKSVQQEALRKKIVLLVKENNQLAEDNRRLQIDMDRALDTSDFKFSDDDDDDDFESGEIKFSALSKVELVTLVKKIKVSESRKMEKTAKDHQEHIAKLKSIISEVKQEKNKVKEERDVLQEEFERVNNDLDMQTDKVTSLRATIDQLERNLARVEGEGYRSSSSREGRRRDVENGRKNEEYSRPSSSRSKRNVQRMRVDSPDERNKAALSIQKHWHAHKNRKRKGEDGIVAVQAALRGHYERSHHLHSKSFSASEVNLHNYQRENLLEVDESSSDTGDSYDDVIYMQSAMRGHAERSAVYG